QAPRCPVHRAGQRRDVAVHLCRHRYRQPDDGGSIAADAGPGHAGVLAGQRDRSRSRGAPHDGGAGFDPAKAAQTLAWLNSATGRSQEQTHWAGTHPGFLDRINAVNAAYAAFAAKRLPLRAWYFKDRREADGVIVTPTKLVEVSDAWSLGHF